MADDATVQQSVNDPFAYLYPYEFMVLTSFRRSGEPKPTPVWFANQGGKMYVTTSMSTGKYKRIRNNGRVLLAPSDARGNLLGQQIEARARILSPEAYEHANEVLRKKYGAQYDAFFSRPGFQGANRTFIEIEPV